MMLVIKTQIYENYGSKDEQYWKPKGGCEHKILDIPQNVDYQDIVDRCNIEFDSDYYREDVISYSLEPDNYLSEYERSQINLEGIITDPEPHIHYAKIKAA